MPVPLGLIGAGVLSGGLGLAQGISGAIKTEEDKRREEELEKLLGLQKTGGLGLTGEERRLREQQLVTPVREVASQLQSRQEAAIGAGAGVSGAELSRLRQETGRTIAGAQQAAATQILEADIAKEQAQRAEIERRAADIEARKKERRASIFGGLSQAAAAAGEIAGAVPEAARAAGLAGAPIRDTEAFRSIMEEQGVPLASQEALLRIGPQKLTRILDNLQSGNIGSEEQELYDILTQVGG